MKMAALPSPTQVAGSHNSIYESYYQLVDPNNQGSVGALDAAKFLKKSGLSDIILSKIWDLSDPNGKGYLNKPGFFVALKLVSLAQNGREVNIANILSDIPPPKMADVPAVIQNNVMNSVQATLSDWAIKPHEREKYDQLFDSLQPMNGVIPGNKVKGLLMDSKLPVDTLGKIWDLADMDKDGSLDRHEFVVAMHLVYKALEKYAIPNTVPPELLPPGKRKDPLPPTTAPIIPIAPITKPVEPVKPVVPPAPQTPWVVTAEQRAVYDVLFHQSDVDKDGFVSGFEIKNVFLQSGVHQAVLAHIWGLCDMKQTGKLNGEQFALAMWLINQKLQGKDPPAALTPEMIPPSARGKPAETVILTISGVERVINSSPIKKNPSKPPDLRVKLLKKIMKQKLKLLTNCTVSADMTNLPETNKVNGQIPENGLNKYKGVDFTKLTEIEYNGQCSKQISVLNSSPVKKKKYKSTERKVKMLTKIIEQEVKVLKTLIMQEFELLSNHTKSTHLGVKMLKKIIKEELKLLFNCTANGDMTNLPETNKVVNGQFPENGLNKNKGVDFTKLTEIEYNGQCNKQISVPNSSPVEKKKYKSTDLGVIILKRLLKRELKLLRNGIVNGDMTNLPETNEVVKGQFSENGLGKK